MENELFPCSLIVFLLTEDSNSLRQLVSFPETYHFIYMYLLFQLAITIYNSPQ